MERLLNFIKTRPFTFIGIILGLLPIFGYFVINRLPSRGPLAPFSTIDLIICIVLGVYLLPILFTCLIGVTGLLLLGIIKLKIPYFVKDFLGWGVFLLFNFFYWRFIGSLIDNVSGGRKWLLVGTVVLVVFLQIYFLREIMGKWTGRELFFSEGIGIY
jgi:hypothetical protein